jgi:hypothetical protein
MNPTSRERLCQHTGACPSSQNRFPKELETISIYALPILSIYCIRKTFTSFTRSGTLQAGFVSLASVVALAILLGRRLFSDTKSCCVKPSVAYRPPTETFYPPPRAPSPSPRAPSPPPQAPSAPPSVVIIHTETHHQRQPLYIPFPMPQPAAYTSPVSMFAPPVHPAPYTRSSGRNASNNESSRTLVDADTGSIIPDPARTRAAPSHSSPGVRTASNSESARTVVNANTGCVMPDPARKRR